MGGCVNGPGGGCGARAGVRPQGGGGLSRFGQDEIRRHVRAWKATQAAVAAEAGRPGAAEWARAALGFEADERQRMVLECEAKRVMLCCSRQWGKSTVTAVRALYEAWFRPGTLVACVAPTERQARFFVLKVRDLAVKRLGTKVRRDPRDAGGAGLSARLENGSAVVGLPGDADTTRGLSAVDFLIVDEAARVRDEVYRAARPFLATTGGRLWLLSTPNGQAGFFHDEWHDEEADWVRVSAPATECGRIGAEFLEGEKRALGEEMFAQEYLCQFRASGSQLIPRALVDEVVTQKEEAMDLRAVFGEED